MAFFPQSGGQFQQAALRLGPRAGILGLAAVLFAGTAVLLPPGQGQRLLWLVGATLGFAALWIVMINARSKQRAAGQRQAVMGLAQEMLVPPREPFGV